MKFGHQNYMGLAFLIKFDWGEVTGIKIFKSKLWYLIFVGCNYNSFSLGGRFQNLRMRWQSAVELLLLAKEKVGNRGEAPKKKFEPKYNVERLDDYGEKPDESFWKNVEKKHWQDVESREGGINHKKLEELGARYPFKGTLEKVVRDVKVGAHLGVSSEFRKSSTATNAPSAIEVGLQVTDAVLGWLNDGYAIGPFEKEEVPFKEYKVSGLMAKIKPNGKARVINNMSRGYPNSVNEGIDKRDFVYNMSSTKAWIRVLIRCGRGCKFTKIDWAEAYKQIPVCKEDVQLQGFAWLGKIFFELALVFGCVSSVGIYDRAAKVVLFLALDRAGVPSHLAIQHLDDVCYCAPEGSDMADRFFKAYVEICKELNVRLADPSQKDKMFKPVTVGQVLGVDYDTMEMVWFLSEEKMRSILELIDELREEREGSARKIKKLCGKLVDIRDLVEGSKFYLAHLIMAANEYNEKEDMEKMVKVDDWLERDLYFFSLVLPTYSRRAMLQDPDRRAMAGSSKAYTDAAGGSRTNLGRGVGMLIDGRMWTLVPWGRRINEGWKAYDGKSLGHKMSAWELVGPLLVVSCSGNRLSGSQVEIFVDNDGSVRMWNKGWTTKCDLCNTILLAVHQISVAMDIEVFISGISRCSTPEADAADALSKSDMDRFFDLVPEADLEPRQVPGALLKWLEDPLPDRRLGHRILKQLARKSDVLGYY